MSNETYPKPRSLHSIVREEDPVVAAIDKLSATVTTRLDAVEKKVETASQSWEKDHKDLTDQVRANAERGETLDEEKFVPLVEGIIAAQQADQVRNRVFNPGEEDKLLMPDPWDPMFDLKYFDGDIQDPTDLLASDIKAMEAGDRKNARKGMEAMIALKPQNELQKRVARMAVDVKIADAIARGNHLLNGVPYDGLADEFPRIGKAWKSYQKQLYQQETGQKADSDLMDTTDMGNWVPTAISAEVRELIMLELRVAALFETITMPRSPFQISVDLTDNEPIYMAETTALPAAYFTDVDLEVFSPSFMLLTASKLRGRMMASGELDEDAVVAILPKMRQKIVKEQADGKEICIIDGQASNEIDTGGGGLAATDCRQAIDGLRYRCIHASEYNGNTCDGATFDIDILLRELRSKLTNAAGRAEYGMDPADVSLVPSIACYLKMLTLTDGTNMVVLTVDKMGPLATIHRGQLGSIGGQAIIPSRHFRQDLNAAGIYDAVTETKTGLLAINPKGFVIGEMRDVTVEASRIPHLDVFELVSFQRFDLQDWYGVSHKFAAYGINVTTA